MDCFGERKEKIVMVTREQPHRLGNTLPGGSIAAAHITALLVLASLAATAHAQPVAPTSDNTVHAAAAPTASPTAVAAVLPATALMANARSAAVAAKAEVEAVPEADQLRSPDAPAFAVLGAAPTDIQKPTTPRDLAVSLSAFVDEQTSLRIPDSVAIQLAPYRLWAHDRLSFEDYATADLPQLWRNLSLSLGTTAIEASTARNLGAGISTHLALDAANLEHCSRLDGDLLQIAKTTSLELSDEEMAELRRLHPETSELENAMRLKKEQRMVEAADHLKPLEKIRTTCAEAATARRHVISLAAGLAWRFPGSAAENGDLISQAYWLTYAYTSGSLSMLGLGRLRLDEAMVGWDGFVDLGARAVVARDAYAGSVELILREQTFGQAASGWDSQLRLTLLVEYMVKDGTWLTLTFGKEFAAADAGALFSLANLTTSFGDPKVKH